MPPMTFTTLTFLVFFGVFLLVYGPVSRRGVAARNLLVVLGSYVFYGWWDWRFLGLIAFSSLVDYGCGLAIHRATEKQVRQFWLGVSLTCNLCLLIYFKYTGFFLASFTDLLHQLGMQADSPVWKVILPVGISFYTFQTMSYTIDIYRRELTPTRNLVQFLAFVSFFPQLVAGPIERARTLLPQFERLTPIPSEALTGGLRLVLWGYFKKITLADNCGPWVAEVFGQVNAYAGWPVALAVMLFSLQIYFDFSAYSDIARGLARMLGFELSVNFRSPYQARSIREFWQRWHISLSTWFRDYVYIPLGGNRKHSQWNTLLTFLLSGLWHGANFTFLLWGGVHGLWLLAERGWKRVVGREVKLPTGIVMVGVSLLWIPFRAANLSEACRVFYSLFSSAKWSTNPLLLLGGPVKLSIGAMALALAWGMDMRYRDLDFSEAVAGWKPAQRWGMYYLLIAGIALLGNFSQSPQFIYFQF